MRNYYWPERSFGMTEVSHGATCVRLSLSQNILGRNSCDSVIRASRVYRFGCGRAEDLGWLHLVRSVNFGFISVMPFHGVRRVLCTLFTDIRRYFQVPEVGVAGIQLSLSSSSSS